MSQIKFEMSLDIKDQKSVKAFADFLNIVAGSAPVEQTASEAKEEAKADEPVKTAPKRASRAKAQTEAKEDTKAPEDINNDTAPEKDEAGSAETKVADAVAKEDNKAEPSVSLDDIRANMSKKVADHREALQKKLKEYGAKNITTLPEDKYDEFNQFILDL